MLGVSAPHPKPNQQHSSMKATIIITTGLVLLTFAACDKPTSAQAGSSEPKPAAQQAPAAAHDSKNITIGKFTVQVPTAWVGFAPNEAASLRGQFMEQSKQIYQQYSGGSDDPAKSVDIAALHIEGNDSALDRKSVV